MAQYATSETGAQSPATQSLVAQGIELKAPTEDFSVPYPPGPVNRLIYWIQQSSVPAWALYSGAAVAIYALLMAVKWWDGTYPPGALSLLQAMFAAEGVGAVAIMHYLDDVARKAMDTFKPAFSGTDAEYLDLRYRLSTLPPRQTLWAAATGIAVFAVLMAFLNLGGFLQQLQIESSPAAAVLGYSLMSAIWALGYVFLFRCAPALAD